MCRLAAFPKGTPKDYAIEVFRNFESCNKDGVGVAYQKAGAFVINKAATSFSEAMAKGDVGLFDHMPYNDSWTIGHVRLKTHGDKAYENTHPFNVGRYAFVHNGMWSDYEKFRELLKDAVKYQGQTDSEIAGHILSMVGPTRFEKIVTMGGVYMGLHKSGEVHIVKTYSGELHMHCTEDEDGNADMKKPVVIASEFPREFKLVKEISSGITILNPDGTIKSSTSTFSNRPDRNWAMENYGWLEGYGNRRGQNSCEFDKDRSKVERQVVRKAVELKTDVNLWHYDPDQHIEDFIGGEL